MNQKNNQRDKMGIENLVEPGDYVQYSEGTKDIANIIRDLTFGVGKVIRANETGIRAEVYEFQKKGMFLGEPNLRGILSSRFGNGKWTHKTKVIPYNDNIVIDDNRQPFLLVKGWLEYGWDEFVKKDKDSDYVKQRISELNKEAETIQEKLSQGIDKLGDEDLCKYLPIVFLAEVAKDE